MEIRRWSLALLAASFLFVCPRFDIGQEKTPKSSSPKSVSGKAASEKETKADSQKKRGPSDAPYAGNSKSEIPKDEDPFALAPGSRQQSDAIWKKKLPGLAFKVMRQHVTETKFSGKYTRSKAKGIYHCAGCGAILFSSDQKFESGTGWPSFFAPLAPENIGQSIDRSLPGETRTEIHCIACEGHLGHVFSDGPAPTGLRFCLNSAALKLDESEAALKLMKDGPQSSQKARESGEKQQ